MPHLFSKNYSVVSHSFTLSLLFAVFILSLTGCDSCPSLHSQTVSRLRMCLSCRMVYVYKFSTKSDPTARPTSELLLQDFLVDSLQLKNIVNFKVFFFSSPLTQKLTSSWTVVNCNCVKKILDFSHRKPPDWCLLSWSLYSMLNTLSLKAGECRIQPFHVGMCHGHTFCEINPVFTVLLYICYALHVMPTGHNRYNRQAYPN